jgi:hypothetical protein
MAPLTDEYRQSQALFQGPKRLEGWALGKIPERTMGFFMGRHAIEANISQQVVVKFVEPGALMMGGGGLNDPLHRVEAGRMMMMKADGLHC